MLKVQERRRFENKRENGMVGGGISQDGTYCWITSDMKISCRMLYDIRFPIHHEFDHVITHSFEYTIGTTSFLILVFDAFWYLFDPFQRRVLEQGQCDSPLVKCWYSTQFGRVNVYENGKVEYNSCIVSVQDTLVWTKYIPSVNVLMVGSKSKMYCIPLWSGEVTSTWDIRSNGMEIIPDKDGNGRIYYFTDSLMVMEYNATETTWNVSDPKTVCSLPLIRWHMWYQNRLFVLTNEMEALVLEKNSMESIEFINVPSPYIEIGQCGGTVLFLQWNEVTLFQLVLDSSKSMVQDLEDSLQSILQSTGSIESKLSSLYSLNSTDPKVSSYIRYYSLHELFSKYPEIPSIKGRKKERYFLQLMTNGSMVYPPNKLDDLMVHLLQDTPYIQCILFYYLVECKVPSDLLASFTKRMDMDKNWQLLIIGFAKLDQDDTANYQNLFALAPRHPWEKELKTKLKTREVYSTWDKILKTREGEGDLTSILKNTPVKEWITFPMNPQEDLVCHSIKNDVYEKTRVQGKVGTRVSKPWTKRMEPRMKKEPMLDMNVIRKNIWKRVQEEEMEE
jgi:hypothetical protein